MSPYIGNYSFKIFGILTVGVASIMLKIKHVLILKKSINYQ